MLFVLTSVFDVTFDGLRRRKEIRVLIGVGLGLADLGSHEDLRLEDSLIVVGDVRLPGTRVGDFEWAVRGHETGVVEVWLQIVLSFLSA